MATDSAHKKLARLQGILRDMQSVLIAYSGGVDSTFLLKVASDTLGDTMPPCGDTMPPCGDTMPPCGDTMPHSVPRSACVLAVTAVSPTYPHEEHDLACAMARSLGVRHISILTNELADPTFSANPPDRCYHCKKELFRKLREIARREGMRFTADAGNADDLSDYRPGRKAAIEAEIRSPLIEAGLAKKEIRLLSKEMGLETWDKPSAACLASRLPYGEPITPEKLQRVDAAEKLLRELLGDTMQHSVPIQVRVRSHGELARIEVESLPADGGQALQQLASPQMRVKVTSELKKLGFTYVTLDLLGYRTGSLNESLPRRARSHDT